MVGSGKPRNPNWKDRCIFGHPALSLAEWAALRGYQHEQLSKYVDTPEARAQCVTTLRAATLEIPLPSIDPDGFPPELPFPLSSYRRLT